MQRERGPIQSCSQCCTDGCQRPSALPATIGPRRVLTLFMTSAKPEGASSRVGVKTRF